MRDRRACLRLMLEWFWEPPHFGDRRIQACAVVVFCMVMIVVVYLRPSSPEIDGRIIDWSFAALLGVVGIYHTARGIDEFLSRRSEVMTSTQSGESAETSQNAETADLSTLR